MEVNNYQSFISYTETLEKWGYLECQVLLFYKQKEPDLTPDDYTGKKKIEILDSYLDIDMDHVTQVCKETKSRCYVTFIDKLFLKTLSKVTMTVDKLIEYLGSEAYEQKGLHLIDIDEPKSIDIRKLTKYLTTLGAKRIQVFPSRSGYSVVFLGRSEIVKTYNESIGETNPNRAHLICALNLYIPDYYGSM